MARARRGSIFACSGSTASGTGGGAACLQQSLCAAQLSAVESGCSSYIACVCPGGVYDPNNVPACTPQEQTSSCMSAITPLGTCEAQSCGSACTTTVTDGG